MNGNDDHSADPKGPIAYMAGNDVAANLFMLLILAAGLVSLSGLERESWPTIHFNQIEVSIAYPGATPEEVEESIIAKVEEQVSSLDDVRAVKSLATPGVASVRLEMKTGTDIPQALDEVDSAVSRIQSFPAGAQRPLITEMTSRQSIIRLVVYGDISERSLKELAYQIEDELASLPPVSMVETSGVRDYEISIEIPLRQLRALGLTLDDVAASIRRNSMDLPAGQIDTAQEQIRVRTVAQRYVQREFENIVVLSRSDGTIVRLGDIAQVRDGFEDADLIVRHQGKPAAFVEVSRMAGEHVMEVATAVQEQVANVIVPSLPEGVRVDILNDESQTYDERVDLLLKNGGMGLLLVLVALALFLEIRLAAWVVVGLVTAFVGVLAVMLAFDVPLHTVSLFVFVLAIGIIVDDAIVVAEHIHLERQRGTPGVVAAIRGARRIRVPLTFAVLTSIVAFTPVLFIPGGIGEIWRALPIMIIAMLLISLFESLLILPNHLSRLHGPDWTPTGGIDRFFARTREVVDRRLAQFIDGPLDRALKFATDQPALVVAGAIGLFIVSVSLLPAGIVPSTFADDVQGDFVTARLDMPDGTTAERTFAVAKALEAAGQRAIEALSVERGDDASSLVTGVTVTVGEGPRREGGGLAPVATRNPQANVAAIEFKLVGAQQRNISTAEVVQAWREEVGFLPHVRGITFSGVVIDLGNPVELVLSHPDTDRLVQVADSVAESLRGIDGVFDVRSDHTPGVTEFQLRLRPEARTLGLTQQALAMQVRAAFFGTEVDRVQRGRDEVRVYARLPEDERNAITDIEAYRIRTPAGGDVPLRQVATLDTGVAPPVIRRKDGQRVVTVTADVDQAVITSGQANAILVDSLLPELTAANPDLTYTMGGEQQQQLDSLDALYRGFAIAMLVMFVLLAIPLRSYTKPFIIMAVIPFGVVGVILGHLALGITFTTTAILGILGLSGVVVNDSLVMIDFIDQRLRDGAPARTAIIEGAKGRFRPIMLTSLTTFLGFTPLILEQAIQAQYLRPFAASLGFGIAITTAILMMLIPALYTIRLSFVDRSARTIPLASTN
ncbi:MAG: efflux RND transporter permease subunit [Gammaproteobacteria bacterium]|nr:efflux RND transporter permease subunit [Gammaproteobacteria bacterium]MYK81993.1 efflux RND transporter permease subunit [Gammaproteobacteria bacterium]